MNEAAWREWDGWDGDGTHKIQVEFRCLQNKAKSGSILAPPTGLPGPSHLATRPSLPDPTHECWHLLVAMSQDVSWGNPNDHVCVYVWLDNLVVLSWGESVPCGLRISCSSRASVAVCNKFAFTFRRYSDVNNQSFFFLLTFLNGIDLSWNIQEIRAYIELTTGWLS